MRATRRRFLGTAIGAMGSLGVAYAAWLPLRNTHDESGDSQSSSWPSPPPGGFAAYSRTSRALGSEVSMTALHPSNQVAEKAVAAAFDELELVEELMSIYRPQSQLSRLNRDRTLEDPHPCFLEVLRAAQTLSRRTDGAFDVTVQPLWAIYAEANKDGRLPDGAEVKAARRKVDWRQVDVSPKRIRLRGEGTAITLNGIAQGFAADRAVAALRSYGVEHALVNTGEIGSLGHKRQGDAWTVGIQHPRQPDAFISLAKLDGRCLATSGDYATSFSPDHMYNHLFDPRTGRSPEELASVSIAAATSTEADALSTAVSVLGLQRGAELVQSTPEADGFFVLKDGRTLTTDGFPS